MSGAARHILIVGLFAALAPVPPRRATGQGRDEATPLPVRLGTRGGVLSASFDVTPAFTEKFRRRLSGGLTSRAVIEMALFDAEENQIAVETRSCQIRLDIWDDVTYVRISSGTEVTRFKFLVIDDALRSCGRVEGTRLTELARLQRPRGYRLAVRVSLNPVSPELLEKSREFMSNPRGTGGGRPRAFFGTVARLFRAEAQAGGEVFLFLSPPLERPRWEVP